MIDDLRHLPRERDAFQIIAPETAQTVFWIGLIVCLLVFG